MANFADFREVYETSRDYDLNKIGDKFRNAVTLPACEKRKKKKKVADAV